MNMLLMMTAEATRNIKQDNLRKEHEKTVKDFNPKKVLKVNSSLKLKAV